MKDITLKEHMQKIGSLGGKALVKKRGRSYMTKLINKRWSKVAKKIKKSYDKNKVK